MDLNQKSWYDEFLSRENSVIIDVRTPEEFSDFRIPNSININFYDSEFFFNQVSSLDKTKNYFIYCKSGVRSNNSCKIMQELGFKNDYNLIGGISDWDGEKIYN